MKVLMLIKSPEYLKKFSPLIQELSARGFSVDIKYSFCANRKSIVENFFSQMRNILSYYSFEDEFSKERYRKFISYKFLLRFNLKTIITFLERLAPVPKFTRDIQQYEALFVVYRNTPGSCLETDYMKAAKRRHIPIFLINCSWDTFETKGILTIEPDVLFVFNTWQQLWVSQVYRFKNIVIAGCPLLSKVVPQNPSVVVYLGSSRITGDGKYIFEQVRRVVGSNIAIKFHPQNVFEVSSDIKIFDTLSGALSSASCVISINSSTIIDAVASGIPSIALFGVTSTSHTQHWKLICDSGLVQKSTISDIPKYIHCWRGPSEILRNKLLFPRPNPVGYIATYMLDYMSNKEKS